MNKTAWLAIFVLVILGWTALSCGGSGSSGSDSDDDGDDDADDDDSADDDTDDDSVDDDSDDDDDDDDGDDDATDDDTADDDGPDYPHDTELRVNQFQALGTHNSYHVQRDGISHPEHRYTHKPLNEQLDVGVRQFELDLHLGADNVIKVYHIPVIDQVTTCDTLVDCLTVIKTWSDAHPGHQPLMVLLEPKDDIAAGIWDDHTDLIEQTILTVWPAERIISPDEVRGDHATLREGVLDNGWPTLGAARNRIIFHLHNAGSVRDGYLSLHPNLVGATLFCDSGPDVDYGAIVIRNSPDADFDDIGDLVQDGYLVRTRADGCCENAENNDHTQADTAIASGANFVSTDFPYPHPETGYVVEIPGGTPSRCNPINAPEWCVSQDIENLPGF